MHHTSFPSGFKSRASTSRSKVESGRGVSGMIVHLLFYLHSTYTKHTRTRIPYALSLIAMSPSPTTSEGLSGTPSGEASGFLLLTVQHALIKQVRLRHVLPCLTCSPLQLFEEDSMVLAQGEMR